MSKLVRISAIALLIAALVNGTINAQVTTSGQIGPSIGSSDSEGGGTGCIPSGAAGQVQYSDGVGGCSNEAAFAYNPATNALTVGSLVLTTDVTFAQITPATAGSKLFGRGDSGAGDIQEITLGANLTMTGTTLAAAGGSGTPGGADTQVQYNNGGAFGGMSGFTYDDGNNWPTVGGAAGALNTVTLRGNAWYFEGATDDTGEIILTWPDPTTGDTTLYLPAVAGGGTLQLAGLDSSAGFGLATQTTSGVWAARSIAAGAGISVANGDGVSGNPTVSVDTATTPQYSQGTADPAATCTAGVDIYTETDTGEVYYCRATNTWDLIYTSNTVVAVADGGTGLSSGTSGGVLAYTEAGTLASSGALTANLPVIGGGAGVAPTVGTRSGNTTAYVTTTGAQTSGDCVSIDANGNHVADGAACGGGSDSFSIVEMPSAQNSNDLVQNTVYWLGGDGLIGTNNAGRLAVPIPVNCTLVSVYWSISVRGTLGTTAQTVLHQISKNESTDTTGVSFDYDATTNTGNETGLSLGFTAGDTLSYKITTPVTWTTAATGVRFNVGLKFTVP